MVNEMINSKGDGNNRTNHPSTEYIPLKGELVAKLVTPHKILLFWEVSQIPQKIIERYFNLSFNRLIPVVRMYDVTDLVFNGKNAHHFFEIVVPYQNGHWFIKGLVANRSYVAELGFNISDREFFPLFRSNSIHTPMMKIPNGNEIHYDLIQLKQHEEHPPKWIDHVSTYSYYEVEKTVEDING
ncbi:DUF4912 domain-containing protein [Bacillus sp. sid0103]|uniref:DUF4912 domain-containing protein n=1 Tax=Bacillus sp. sid0103 TaxID=2856337 RepID=UPI001C4696D1|nr:DUF4912 domain-containing protein [Bacillus sp. sid0103]MBV7507485.1 DUF4912 domain-containing protein [Bacillus sp. sid0103]